VHFRHGQHGRGANGDEGEEVLGSIGQVVPGIPQIPIPAETLDEADKGREHPDQDPDNGEPRAAVVVVDGRGGHGRLGQVPPGRPAVPTAAKGVSTNGILEIQQDRRQGLHLIHQPKVYKGDPVETGSEDASLQDKKQPLKSDTN